MASPSRNYAATYTLSTGGRRHGFLVDTVQEDQRILMGPKKTGRVRDSAKGLTIPQPRENMLPSDKPNLPQAETLAGKITPPFDRLPPKERALQLWAEQQPALKDAEDSQKEWSAEYMARLYANPKEASLGTIPLLVLARAQGGYGSDLDVPCSRAGSRPSPSPIRPRSSLKKRTSHHRPQRP